MNLVQFLKLLVILNGTVPLIMLVWDAWRGQLGANSVNNALHITGIVSLVFLLLSLIMTPLRWITGWGGWIAFRRALGLYGFAYAVLHLAIYVGLDRALSLSSTLHEIATRRFLQVGAVAILLMIPLAITSTSGMLRRLGAKRWKLLHRAAYPVAILGVLHYYMLVKSDVRQPLAFGVVLAGLLGARVGRHYLELRRDARRSRTSSPANSLDAGGPISPATGRSGRPWKGELKIAAIFCETHDVKTFRLIAANGGNLPFDYQPGQYLNLQLTIDGERVNRSYTLASSPTRGAFCELSIKREPKGLASRYLHDHLQVGDVLRVSGPAGKFVFTGADERQVLLIAGGVGITPVMSILRSLTDRAWEGDIYFAIVARSEHDLIFQDELLWLQQRFPRLQVCRTLTRCDAGSRWTGERGRLSESLLQRFVPDLHQTPVFLCGPDEMMDATRELLRKVGVPDGLVHTEAFVSRKAMSAEDATGTELTDPSVLVQPTATVSLKPAGSLSTIHFARSNIQAQISSETTILEAAEDSSVEIPYECRSGICGQCKTRLVGGNVVMDCDDALSRAEQAAGFVLACQARPLAHLIVEA